MSDFVVNYPGIGVPLTPVSVTASAPQFPIGVEVVAFDRAASTAGGGAAGIFVYARGSNIASIGQFCHLVNGSAVLLASGNSASAYPIGCAAGLLSATNAYGWVQVQGRVDYARGTNTAPSSNVPVHMCGTNGIVLSNVNNNRIWGIVGNTAVTATASSAGSYVYDLFRPFAPGPMSATNAGGY